jgi:hypothetical protein
MIGQPARVVSLEADAQRIVALGRAVDAEVAVAVDGGRQAGTDDAIFSGFL